MTKSYAVPGESRTAARETLTLAAKLRRGGGAAHRVTVRNLSAAGVLIESDLALAEDDPVVVEIAGLGKVDGTIAWTEGNRAGMAFAAPVDPALAKRSRLKIV